MSSMAKKAKNEFSKIDDDRRKYVYVFSEDFEGMFTNSLPSFWSEKLSSTTVDFNSTGELGELDEPLGQLIEVYDFQKRTYYVYNRDGRRIVREVIKSQQI